MKASKHEWRGADPRYREASLATLRATGGMSEQDVLADVDDRRRTRARRVRRRLAADGRGPSVGIEQLIPMSLELATGHDPGFSELRRSGLDFHPTGKP